MKPKDSIWNLVDIIEDGTKKTAQCKGCKLFVSAKSERLKAHRLKCCGSSEADTQQVFETEAATGNSDPKPLIPAKRKIIDGKYI